MDGFRFDPSLLEADTFDCFTKGDYESVDGYSKPWYRVPSVVKKGGGARVETWQYWINPIRLNEDPTKDLDYRFDGIDWIEDEA